MESRKQSPYDFSSNAPKAVDAFRERFRLAFVHWLGLCGLILLLQSLIFWVLHGGQTTSRSSQAFMEVIKIGFGCCLVASIAIVPFRNRYILVVKYFFWSLVVIVACYVAVEVANLSLGAS